MSTITLSVGQMVDWPPAPDRLAQIEELMRSRVRIVYRCKSGTIRRPIVPAGRISLGQTFMPGVSNVLGRAVLPRTKTFDTPPPKSRK